MAALAVRPEVGIPIGVKHGASEECLRFGIGSVRLGASETVQQGSFSHSFPLVHLRTRTRLRVLEVSHFSRDGFRADDSVLNCQ
jgi:hypothetical protein